MVTNKIAGDCIELIENDSDFKEWGIDIWKHRRVLFKNMQQLIENKQNAGNDGNEPKQYEYEIQKLKF